MSKKYNENTFIGRNNKTIILTLLAAVFLVVTNSAIWINNYIFDRDNFTVIATNSITQEDSLNAIATDIVDRIYQDRPVLKNFAGETTNKLVSSLLSTDRSSQALSKAIGRLHVMITSENSESITLELSSVKIILSKVVNIVSDDSESRVDPSKIPDEIVIIDANKLPKLYKSTLVFLWIAPLALISALILIAIPYLKEYKSYKKIMMIQGFITFAIGLLALSIGPLFKPPLLSNISNSSGRVVVGNLYDSFIATFNSQTLVIVWLGVAAMSISGSLYAYQYIKKK